MLVLTSNINSFFSKKSTFVCVKSNTINKVERYHNNEHEIANKFLHVYVIYQK